MRTRIAALTAGACLLCAGAARSSTLADSALALQLLAGSASMTFPLVTGAQSYSTGPITFAGYSISNITLGFEGPGSLAVNDPLQLRLSGIGSITCDSCTDPLEIDFLAEALPDTASGFYFDQVAMQVDIALSGSLGDGSEVPAELVLLFGDGSLFDLPMLLQPGMPFSQSGGQAIATGAPVVEGAFFLGCGCALLGPNQAFSMPDSVSVTFELPEPATWAVSGFALLGLTGVRRLKRKARA